jgi:hypothetical protein
MTMMLNSSLNSASDASMPQRVDLASPGMLGNLFSPVQDKVQSLQVSTLLRLYRMSSFSPAVRYPS